MCVFVCVCVCVGDGDDVGGRCSSLYRNKNSLQSFHLSRKCWDIFSSLLATHHLLLPEVWKELLACVEAGYLLVTDVC